jgi:hypothetical protein
MAKGAKHPGDDGNWNLDSANPVPMTIKQRIDTQMGVTSPAVIEAMRKEEAFLATVHGKLGAGRSHKPPGRG